MTTEPPVRQALPSIAHVRIGEVLVDGPSLAHRERAALQAYVEHHLARLLHGAESTPELPGRVPPFVDRLGRRIVADVAASVAAALPTGAVLAPAGRTSRGRPGTTSGPATRQGGAR